MRIAHDRLKRLVTAIFEAAGLRAPEPEKIAHHLVDSNLAGHDSHGVIRVPAYVGWLKDGKIFPNKHVRIVFENEAVAVLDGQFGFGQVLGEETMELGIRKCAKHGVAVVALRNSGHLGRIGDWAEMAVRAGKISLHFVNTSGAGILVAPTGGISRRLSANPVAAGVPVKNGPPMILDISTSTIAEGKVKVALNKGVPAPDNCLIDPQGRPTNDPKTFYGPPPGAILPFGGHKGYALGMIAEMLAGALTGGSCSDPKNAHRVVNNMLTIVLDPRFFEQDEAFAQEVNRFIAYVRSSDKVSPDAEILMPGEPEARTREKRARDGIEIADTTWNQIRLTARSVNLIDASVNNLIV